MKLDLSSFEKALHTLEVAMDAHQQEPQDSFIKDACIQRFEYSYELSYKMLRRYLVETEATSIDALDMSFPNIVRLGYARGLLHSELLVWKTFRDARNMTSHTYDEGKSLDVLKVIPDFLQEANFLLEQIRKRQESMS